MKIEYKVYCHEHAEELEIKSWEAEHDTGLVVTNITYEVTPCSQCMLESYEKGIESLLAKGWPAMKGEL